MAVSKVAVAAMVGTALASNLATIAPCTQKPGLYPDEVVTAQFQAVSYCVPSQTIEYSTSTSSGYGTVYTKVSTITTTVYPMASTSIYVSTVIPCAYDGSKALSSCTVTTTDQSVDCRESSTTITSYKPYQTTTVYPITTGPAKYGYGNQTYHNVTSYTTKTVTSTETHYTTVSKHYDAEFNQIGGGWVIPGYAGSPIDKDDHEDASGSKYQHFNVTDCKKVDNGTFSCSKYSEVWTSKTAPSSTSKYSSVVTTHATASSAGTYPYTFTQTAPAATYTAPASGTNPASVITAPAQTWEYTTTKTCTGPTTWDITKTISTTITYTCPYEHSTPPGQSPSTYTTGGAQPTGAYPTGGSYPTGGNPTGGSYPTGGNPTGGSYPTGGNPTGGSYPTGGNPTGGSYPTGGNPTGGSYPTGGNPTSGGSYPTGGNPTTGGSNPTGGNPTTGGTYPTGGNPTTGGSNPTGSCNGEFKLSIYDTTARFQKSNFVGFDGDDATTHDSSTAAIFTLSGGNLQTGSDYVATSGSSQYAPFEKSASTPSGSNMYSVDASGNLQLSGAKGFCQKDNAIFVIYNSAPYGCSPVELQKKDIPQYGCSTTSYAPTTTTGSATITTSTTTTASTPDISGDMGYEPSTTTAAQYTHYRNKRYVIRAN